jgi:hypothetical protein
LSSKAALLTQNNLTSAQLFIGDNDAFTPCIDRDNPVAVQRSTDSIVSGALLKPADSLWWNVSAKN